MKKFEEKWELLKDQNCLFTPSHAALPFSALPCKKNLKKKKKKKK